MIAEWPLIMQGGGAGLEEGRLKLCAESKAGKKVCFENYEELTMTVGLTQF